MSAAEYFPPVSINDILLCAMHCAGAAQVPLVPTLIEGMGAPPLAGLLLLVPSVSRLPALLLVAKHFK